MKTEQEYIKDLSEIRQMMEKSSKFLSLAGWSGILAGLYALAGIAFINWQFAIIGIESFAGHDDPEGILYIIVVAFVVLLLAVSTCIFLSYKKAQRKNETLWNATTRRLVMNMAIPLVTGGIFILILISRGEYELMASLTLIFYGLSLVNASRFTFDELRYMGILEILLGLLCAFIISWSFILWALGFGLLHIGYGIYMHWRYER